MSQRVSDVTIDVTNPEISAVVQEVLFRNGYEWCGTRKKISETHDRYINVRLANKSLIKGYDEPSFKLIAIADLLDKPIVIGGYEVKIYKDTVFAERTTFTYEQVKEIVSRMKGE